MPDAGLLSTEELNAVVEQVKAFSGAFSASGRPICCHPKRLESVDRGRCCSPTKKAALGATATPAAAASVSMTNAATRYLRAISPRPTFRGGSRPQDIWLRLKQPDSCPWDPCLRERVPADARWDLVNFVASSPAGRHGRRAVALEARDLPLSTWRLHNTLGSMRPLPYAN